MMVQRTGEERFVMGALMFDAAREIIIAPLPKDLPPMEFKHRLFERIYGCSMESVLNAECDKERQSKRSANTGDSSALEITGL